MSWEVLDGQHVKGIPANDGKPTEDAGEKDCNVLHWWQEPDQQDAYPRDDHGGCCSGREGR